MKRPLLLALCSTLLCFTAWAQTIVAGRVLDAGSAAPLPGATILQTGTLNGIVSDTEGNFELTVPSRPDSISLTVSYLGYGRQQLWVAAGSHPLVHLAADTRLIECEVTRYPLLTLGLTSGLRYAPYGASLQLYGERLVRLPISTTASYQTNFAANHALNTRLTLPGLNRRHRLKLYESLGYQQLQAIPARLSFRSYGGTLSFYINRIGPVRVPTLVLGAGYARLHSLTEAETPDKKGMGYSLGLSHSVQITTFQLNGNAQVTRWPGYWQVEGNLTTYIGHGMRVGIAANQLLSYSELSLQLSRAFF